MKVALLNPRWSFEGSIYFGCREPHLPLELGYAKLLLERGGHEALLVDAHLGVAWGQEVDAIDEPRDAVAAFAPDVTVVTTAPTYLFWRCPPPELRVPMRALDALRDVAGFTVAVGPHASTTPAATMRKLRTDAVVLGECEEALVDMADAPPERWGELSGVATALDGGGDGKRRSVDLQALPALLWPAPILARHLHHHHRFDQAPDAPGAEIEASRGCPYHCTFCAKSDHRDRFRKRPLEAVLAELDAVLERGARYVYFIDEIFVPDAKLLAALCERDVRFGVQMRIDNWSKEMLELLGRAGCVSIEAGVESITERGRSLLAKRCKASTEELAELLVHARRHVPFVQANLLQAATDPPEQVASWRAFLQERDVWSNEPVPLFPYPGSPEYAQRFGPADDHAWERAHAHYLEQFDAFSDIQDQRPLPLDRLEGDA